jgi:hypothetical protein
VAAGTNDPLRALEGMQEALTECTYLVPRVVTGAVDNGATLESFVETFRELSRVAVELHHQLGEGDPLHATLKRTLIDAQSAWTAILLEGTVHLHGEAVDGEVLAPAAPAPSTALVSLSPIAPAPSETRRQRSRPDEAVLARYLRHRRGRERRLPDEAAVARWLRERRGHDRRLPDQAVLARYLRERRRRD